MKNETTTANAGPATHGTTIIDDTQFRFPVGTEELTQWEAENGRLNAANYEQFCSDVSCALPDVPVGTAEMIDVCSALIESGAPHRIVSGEEAE